MYWLKNLIIRFVQYSIHLHNDTNFFYPKKIQRDITTTYIRIISKILS